MLFEQAVFPNQHKQPAHQLFHVTFHHAALPGEVNQHDCFGGRFAEDFSLMYAEELASLNVIENK